MIIESLPLPVALTELIESGNWPANAAEANQQHRGRMIPSHLVKEVADDEEEIYLHPAPFHTIAHECGKSRSTFWDECGALNEIDPSRAVILGDFGMGSDSPIILDYRVSLTDPEVWRLKWGEPYGSGNHWKIVAPTFSQFASKLRLTELRFRTP